MGDSSHGEGELQLLGGGYLEPFARRRSRPVDDVSRQVDESDVVPVVHAHIGFRVVRHVEGVNRPQLFLLHWVEEAHEVVARVEKALLPVGEREVNAQQVIAVRVGELNIRDGDVQLVDNGMDGIVRVLAGRGFRGDTSGQLVVAADSSLRLVRQVRRHLARLSAVGFHLGVEVERAHPVALVGNRDARRDVPCGRVARALVRHDGQRLVGARIAPFNGVGEHWDVTRPDVLSNPCVVGFKVCHFQSPFLEAIPCGLSSLVSLVWFTGCTLSTFHLRIRRP